jgi:hypothetical protein
VAAGDNLRFSIVAFFKWETNLSLYFLNSWQN